jgi:glycosyltransferase involved in cell wall biosynthesis
MERISVIIPTYNSGRFINDAIRSVISQTCQPDEIIIIDDGSTDNTRNVVESTNDNRIKYIYQENAGVSSARNLGLKVCSGDFVAFLDADDMWRPTMLEEQSSILASDKSIVCSIANFIRFINGTKCKLADQFQFYPELNQKNIIPGQKQNSFIVNRDAFCSLVGFGEIPSFTPVIMFRKSLISGVKFPTNMRICEDTVFVLCALMRGSVVFNRNILAEVRRHESNVTRDYSLIAIDKLKAFQAILPEITRSDHLLACNDRIVKAYIDAARACRAQLGLKTCINYYIGALGIKGSFLRKIKGAISIFIDLVMRK